MMTNHRSARALRDPALEAIAVRAAERRLAMRKKKVNLAFEDALTFLLELADPIESDDLPPAIRIKARRLVFRLDAATKRGAGSNLEPGDSSRIFSRINRMIAAKLSLHKAAERLSERFHVTPRQIEQIYKKTRQEFSKPPP